MPVSEGGHRDHDHVPKKEENESQQTKRRSSKDKHTCLVAPNLLVRPLGLVSFGHNWRNVAAGGAVAVRGGHGRHGSDLGCGGGCYFGYGLVMVQKPRLRLKMSGTGREMIGGPLREVEEGAAPYVAVEMRGTSHEPVQGRAEPASNQLGFKRRDKRDKRSSA